MSAIPAELLLPMIERHLEEYDIPVEELSEQLGYHAASIRKRIDYGFFTFRMADKILARTHNFLAWYREPLLFYYWEGDPPPDRAKPLRCKNPNCETWFALEEVPTAGGVVGGSRVTTRSYCSERCSQATRSQRYRVTTRGRSVNRKCANRDYYKHHEKRTQAMRDYHAKNRERRIAYMRAYRQQKREAVAA